MTEPMKTADEIKSLRKALLQGFEQCRKEKSLDECSFGYEKGVLITGNDAKYLISLIDESKNAAQQVAAERDRIKKLAKETRDEETNSIWIPQLFELIDSL